MSYVSLMHPKAFSKVTHYLKQLKEGALPGGRLKRRLQGKQLNILTEIELLHALVNTKLPQIFAESDVLGDGSDWTMAELGILGDLGVAVPVTVFDDGSHDAPRVHVNPIDAMLLFTCGALLAGPGSSRWGGRLRPADWDEVVEADEINTSAFNALYERRLVPLFYHVNSVASSKGRAAVITIPGLGCGQFAGPFRGTLEKLLFDALLKIIEEHANKWPAIRLIRFSAPGCPENASIDIGHIDYRMRRHLFDGSSPAQLCHPTAYEEGADDFSNCDLYSFVAWDHVSWPGNDFYRGSRMTDDGVKAAATNAIGVMTGRIGHYDAAVNKYQPPAGSKVWADVVERDDLVIDVVDRLLVGW